MYQPPYHALNDTAAMHAHLRAYPLGAWVCSVQQDLVANHLPFVLDTPEGQPARLLGHVARANTVWQGLQSDTPSVVMFMGPQAYISPDWYPSKNLHGEVVPTWNYVTVHAHGTARAVHDPDWILSTLQRLTDAQETKRPRPWRVSDAPQAYIGRLLQAVVGIEIAVTRLEGRLKASQDETPEDRAATMHALQQTNDSSLQAMAQVMAQF